MKLPLAFGKILSIIDDSDTNRRTTVEEDIVRKFRLSKDDLKPILNEFEEKGLIKRGKYTLERLE